MKDVLFKVLISGGSASFSFPVAAVTRTVSLNTVVLVADSVSTLVIAGNASRMAAYVVNPNPADPMFIGLGGAASTGTIRVGANGVFAIELDALGGIYKGDVRVFHSFGIGTSIPVLEYA